MISLYVGLCDVLKVHKKPLRNLLSNPQGSFKFSAHKNMAIAITIS